MNQSFWSEGEVVTIAGRVGGKIWWADPMNVVRDSAELTVLYMGPAAQYLMPDRVLELSSQERHSPLKWSIRDSGDWNLVAQTWRATHVLTFLYPSKYYSIRMFFSEANWNHICWYVNFQRPYQRTDFGFEALDLALDIVVPADDPHAQIMKDEEQYSAGVAAGAITDEDVAGIDEARAELADGIPSLPFEPFRSDWRGWRPRESWPALVVPTSHLPGQTR